jgi:hypothetical protein
MEVLYAVERRGDPKDWQIICYDGQPGGEVIATCKSQVTAWKICGLLQAVASTSSYPAPHGDAT